MKPALLTIFLANYALCQVCRTTTTCDHEPVYSDNDVIRRGKSGPRGEKGDTGAKGADHGEDVLNNSRKISESLNEIRKIYEVIFNNSANISRSSYEVSKSIDGVHNNTAVISKVSAVVSKISVALSKHKHEVEIMNQLINNQSETIGSLFGVVEKQAAKITYLYGIIDVALSLFFVCLK